MIIKSTKKIILVFSSLFLAAGLYAETFRVSKLHEVHIENLTVETVVKAGINESIAIFLPEDKTFIEGLELKMDIPEAIAEWMDSVACSVYENISPVPDSSNIDYSGTRSFVSTLPGKLSWILQIPLTKDNSLKSNNYITKMDSIPDSSKNFIFVRLQPAMKGIPDEVFNSIISISVKPLLTNKGLLSINLSSADKELSPCSVYIDEKITAWTPQKNTLLLEKGIHDISIISNSYRNEVRTVRIEQAKISTVNVEMKSNEPTLLILAPEGTKILIDDAVCSKTGQEFVISEGEHKIQFSIGDYEIVRSITAVKGRSYTANFTVDLQVSEE